MYNKIDKNILDKICMFDNQDRIIDVIVKVKSVYDNQPKFKDFVDGEIEIFPFVSSVVFKTNIKNIFKIAKQNQVCYISENAKVNSLVYNAKNFVNYNSLDKNKLLHNNHTCVIIDTGVYPHIDLVLGKNKIIKFVDLVNGYEKMYDDNGHGTFVAGIIASNGFIDKVVGFDNNCDIVVIKGLDKNGETTTSKILEAMQWVLKNKQIYNIKIVCMSFGSLYRNQDPLVLGADMLWNNGIVVVAAAGNNGPESNTIMSPGANKKIITVGALDTTKNNNIRVADFSSRGPVNNYYKPDVVLPGVDIVSCNVFSKNRKFYTTLSGTSMAAPMVAGIVSLLFSINPNYTPNQIKYMIVKSCGIKGG